jgi:hypothetical protein
MKDNVEKRGISRPGSLYRLKQGNDSMRLLLSGVFLVLPIVGARTSPGEEFATISFRSESDRVIVLADKQQIAEYVLRDERIPRPYFSHLRTLVGVQVTRNHPPREDDLKDHDTFHPGLWMAFGDLSLADNWRLKAAVRHERFVDPPEKSAGRGGFTVENRYLNERGDAVICREIRRLDFHVLSSGWLLSWDSKFFSDRGDLTFGDQEEMGLGVRVATPLAVVSHRGGRILDAQGNVNEAGGRGKIATWCDYSGPLEGRFAGVTIFSHPENFRPSWQHVRDYGLMVANPFGRRALTGGEESRVVIKQGDSLRLRFGVLVHESQSAELHRPGEVFKQYLSGASGGTRAQ